MSFSLLLPDTMVTWDSGKLSGEPGAALGAAQTALSDPVVGGTPTGPWYKAGTPEHALIVLRGLWPTADVVGDPPVIPTQEDELDAPELVEADFDPIEHLRGRGGRWVRMFHGTNREFKPGDLVEPQEKTGAPSIWKRGEHTHYSPKLVYGSTADHLAERYAVGRAGRLGGKPRVYEVEPVGEPARDAEYLASGFGSDQVEMAQARVVREVPLPGTVHWDNGAVMRGPALDAVTPAMVRGMTDRELTTLLHRIGYGPDHPEVRTVARAELERRSAPAPAAKGKWQRIEDGYQRGNIEIHDNGGGMGPSKDSGRWAVTVAGKWISNEDTLMAAKAKADEVESASFDDPGTGGGGMKRKISEEQGRALGRGQAINRANQRRRIEGRQAAEREAEARAAKDDAQAARERELRGGFAVGDRVNGRDVIFGNRRTGVIVEGPLGDGVPVTGDDGNPWTLARASLKAAPVEEFADPGTPELSPLLDVGNLASVYDGFAHGGLRMVVEDRQQLNENDARVQGTIQEDGRDVGGFAFASRRDTATGEVTVLHDTLYLDHDVQNRGFAHELFHHAYGAYRAGGVEAVNLTTAEVGGYAWARDGYDFDLGHYALLAPNVMQNMDLLDDRRYVRASVAHRLWGSRVFEELPGEPVQSVDNFAREKERGDVPDGLWSDFARRFPTRDQLDAYAAGDHEALAGCFTEPLEIATFGRQHTWTETHDSRYQGHLMWLGKRFMLGSNWRGRRDLMGGIQEAESPTLGRMAVIAAEVSEELGMDVPPDGALDDEADRMFWETVEARLGESA